MRKIKQSEKTGYLLILPLMAGCLVFFAIPLCMVFGYSFRDGIGSASEFAGLENYRELLQNGVFRVAFSNTVKFLGIGLPLILVLSYLVAIYMRKYIKKDSVLHLILLTPYIMPVVGTLVVVELLFDREGWFSQIMLLMGIPVRSWLESPAAFGIVLLLYIWKNIGYSVVLLLSGLLAIPEEQYASASLDGAGGVQSFFYITVPQMWDSVLLAFLFSLINAFKCFREIFLIGGKHPNIKIYMLQHFLNNSFEKLNYARLSATSILLFGVTVAVVGSLYIWINRRKGSVYGK